MAIINNKNLEKMKKFKYLILSLSVVFALASCEGDFFLVDDDNDRLTGGAVTGGLATVNPLMTYVVGSGASYMAAGSVYQGKVQTTSIDVYKSFTDNVTGTTSNEVLFSSVSIANTNVGDLGTFELNFTYEDLINGLTLSGSPLPGDDSALNIGDFWTLRYVSNTSTGNQNVNGNITKVAVGTRYAGVYDVVESEYWNSGGFNGNWNGGARVIESVDATIYRHVGLAFWDDNEFYFSVDNDTNVITIFDYDLGGADLLLNGSPAMVCDGPYAFESLTCDDTTTRATPDDVNGIDQLEFVVGYFRGVGATREFYEKLIKR